MILTEVASELGRTTGDAAIEAAADDFAGRVMRHFVRPQRRCLLEFLDYEYREVAPPEGTFVMPGHAIESMWPPWRLIDQATSRLGTLTTNHSLPRTPFPHEGAIAGEPRDLSRR